MDIWISESNHRQRAYPRRYSEAVKSTSKAKWAVAIDEELKALEENGVWEVVVPPKGSHVLHNKYLFKTKTDADGNVEKYKARIVACGNEQLGIVKVILVLSRRWNVPARHGDIPNAYVKAEKEKHLTFT